LNIPYFGLNLSKAGFSGKVFVVPKVKILGIKVPC